MAARFWKGGGSSTNWNATGNTNWASSSGGANNETIPGISDDVTFDSAGNSASVISATITILSLTIVTGFTSTITHNFTLTVAGNVTLVTGYTIAGVGLLTISAAATLTSNGKTWPNAVSLTGTATKVFADAWTIVASLAIVGTQTVTINGLVTCATINLNTNASTYTFGGSTGFTTGTLNVNANAPVIIFVNAVAYTVTTAFNSFSATAAAHGTMSSASAGNQAIFILSEGAAANVGNFNATDIDSSLGRMIWTWNGVLSNTKNWSVLADVVPIYPIKYNRGGRRFDLFNRTRVPRYV